MNNLLTVFSSLRIHNNFVVIRGSQHLKFKSNKSSSSSSSSSSDEDVKSTPKSESKKVNQEALNKLSDLLKKMVKEDVGTETSKLNLARPKSRRNLNAEVNTESVKEKTTEEKMVTAVKNVAQSFGGDAKQTESELLMKLLNPIEEKPTTSLTDLVKGMQIDRETNKDHASRSEQVKNILSAVQRGDTDRRVDYSRKRTKQGPVTVGEKIDLFGSERLGIFSPQELSSASEGVQNETWNKLQEKELKLSVTHPPRNYFQQMILWTEQGKIWKFPIDNEQGLEKEHSVYFTEHVFLEKHLEPWCPTKGPLRHFMELVCVGLSKNPYLTVEAKKEHIDWFRKYFEDKKQLLKDVGALQDTPPTKPKTIEA